MGYAAGALQDSWESSRDMIECVLMRLPSPLAGYEEVQDVTEILDWAQSLLSSARLYEADAGMLLGLG